MASYSKLDAIYRSILLAKFFTKGWGKPENLKRLFAFRKIISNRETCRYLVEPDYPIVIDKIEKHPTYQILDGQFVSPFVHHLPEVVPEEARIARFQIILPKPWPPGSLYPMCLHLAGTGDHFFWRRRMLMARPLLKEAGIGSILLENPFYGTRKPKHQTSEIGISFAPIKILWPDTLPSLEKNWPNLVNLGNEDFTNLFHSLRSMVNAVYSSSILNPCHIEYLLSFTKRWPCTILSRSSLHNVSDIFVMGGCLILESLALFHWCERQGYGPLGISGISMGGHMASLAGCSWHKPLPIIPCLSWTTASCVFTQGVMSAAIPWPLLETQYSSDNVYQDEIRRMLHSPEERDAFLAGIHFSRTYPSSLKHMQRLKAERNENNTVCNDSEKKIHTSKSSASPEDMRNKFFPPSLLEALGIHNSGHKSKSSLGSDFNFSSHEEASSFMRKDTSSLKLEALSFMRGVMDECTHLGNFSTPVDPSLSIIVTAKHDAYIPRDGIKSISDLWPGCDVRYIDAGHIAAFLFNQGVFRKAIIDGFEKTAQKYYGNSIITDEMKPALKRDANS